MTTPMNNHAPLQLVFSFEGLVNNVLSHDDVLTCAHPPAYDLSNFERRVREKLQEIRDAGIGGVVVNYGYADEYLEGEEGWKRFLTGLKAAVELGLRIWIFDEKGYPSGSAGGKVLKGHPELEAIGLKHWRVTDAQISKALLVPDPRATIYAAYGTDIHGKRRKIMGKSEGREVIVPADNFKAIDIYFLAPLYEGTHPAMNLAVARRYLNVLDERAVNRFLELTHVKYFERIPAHLRRHVEAFFTDEFSMSSHALKQYEPAIVEDPVDLSLPIYPAVPWCGALEAEFFDRNGYALEPHVPSLFAGQEPPDRRVRREFRAVTSRLYAQAFPAQGRRVCSALGFEFAGHLLGEDTILQQAILHGDLIQVLKEFDRPGLDLLTCKVELFANHLLTHKCAQSASFFGSGKGVLSETSDYFEWWIGDRKGAALEEILCVLALQYLLGVRDFGLMFFMPRFKPETYRALCGFVERLCRLGEGRRYRPECALYYPIEKVWEGYVPTVPTGDIFSAGIFARTVTEAGPELNDLCRLTTSTLQRLFFANVQYMLCERPDVARLPGHGITKLVHFGPGAPESDLEQLARQADVELVTRQQFESSRAKPAAVQAGPGVVYATYQEFIFAVNMGSAPSSLVVSGEHDVIYPLISDASRRVRDAVELAPLTCAFVR